MNARKAKQIRRLARKIAQGKPERQYQKTPSSGKIELVSGCERDVHKSLKRNVKKMRQIL